MNNSSKVTCGEHFLSFVEIVAATETSGHSRAVTVRICSANAYFSDSMKANMSIEAKWVKALHASFSFRRASSRTSLRLPFWPTNPAASSVCQVKLKRSVVTEACRRRLCPKRRRPSRPAVWNTDPPPAPRADPLVFTVPLFSPAAFEKKVSKVETVCCLQMPMTLQDHR